PAPGARLPGGRGAHRVDRGAAGREARGGARRGRGPRARGARGHLGSRDRVAVTKAERGYRLARATPPVPVHARPVVLDASMTPRAAARDLMGAALAQLQANEEGV